jgi:predicted GNAT superfamily acetyltransferase
MPIAADAAVPRRLTNRSPRFRSLDAPFTAVRYGLTNDGIVCVAIRHGQAVGNRDANVGSGVTDRPGKSVSITMPTTADEMVEVVGVFDAVWGSTPPVATVELLTAVAHAGGYVSLARDDTRPGAPAVGASLGILARHDGAPALHSHVTGLVADARGTGAGRALKLHQREWTAASGLEQIVWTFDPLVRRNAWFNLAVLGARVRAYLPSFYGTMSDAINAGDESDRLLVAWDVHAALPTHDEAQAAPAADSLLVPTPADVVELRRTDPAAVARWRADTRRALTAALDDGRSIVGFTTAGNYVIGSMR